MALPSVFERDGVALRLFGQILQEKQQIRVVPPRVEVDRVLQFRRGGDQAQPLALIRKCAVVIAAPLQKDPRPGFLA